MFNDPRYTTGTLTSFIDLKEIYTFPYKDKNPRDIFFIILSKMILIHLIPLPFFNAYDILSIAKVKGAQWSTKHSS